MAHTFNQSSSLVEDSEVFEITDFTTASDWEKFIASLEEILSEWKLSCSSSYQPLPKDIISSGTWKEVNDHVLFADIKFKVSHFYLDFNVDNGEDKEASKVDGDDIVYTPCAIRDLMSNSNDFPAKAHCLTRWYGLRDLIVISSTNEEVLTNESRVKLILSSLNIAILNSACEIPVFVQVDKIARRLFFGVCEGGGLRTDFEMIHLKRVPKQFMHLSGLLDMFKRKIACPIQPFPSVTVTIRLTYLLNQWPDSLVLCDLPDYDDHNQDLVGDSLGEFWVPPFGACEEPISDVQLMVTWPRVAEEMVVDEEHYSDLEPTAAPQWAARIRFVDSPQCLLGEALRLWLQLCRRRETLAELFQYPHNLGESMSDEDGVHNSKNALNRLTQSPSGLRNVVRRAKKRFRQNTQESTAPLDDDTLNQLLFFIFPDAQSESDGTRRVGEKSPGAVALASRVKAAPLDSLTHRLAVTALSLHQARGMGALAQLWYEVVLELRYRLENSLLLPNDVGPHPKDNNRSSAAVPDTGTCLLHQKFQLLNLCILRKTEREARERAQLVGDVRVTCDVDTASSEEEDFQDAVEEQDCPADGRLRRFGDLYLLWHPDRALYEPITQPGVPMTEDMLEEHADAMTALGTSAEAAEQRARMQSASLQSDMEAFKAANPGCVLEDFVRWYSPRDFDVTEGKLSARMCVEGNLWSETWSAARCTPARLQRRLFDDTKEAEKVLQFLSTLRPGDLAQQLMPSVMLTALLALHERHEPALELASRNMRTEVLEEKLSKLSREHFSLPPSMKHYSEIVRLLSHEEVLHCRARSLRLKLMSGQERLQPKLSPEELRQVDEALVTLLSQPEVKLLGAARGPVGRLLKAALLESPRTPSSDEAGNEARLSKVAATVPFPVPVGREFILRCEAQRNTPYSRSAPQRLYCALTSDEFRFAGAFTTDSTFF